MSTGEDTAATHGRHRVWSAAGAAALVVMTGCSRRIAYDSAATRLYDSSGDGGHFLYRVERGTARYLARLDAVD
ncbi:hypothetical protein ACWFR1_40025 [Streptomyces sp. NPDC055103]